MPNRIDDLLTAYDKVVNEPWSTSIAGQERVWFLVYDPADQRMVDFRLKDFETTTIKAGKKWRSISLKPCFPNWMANHEYREEYFKNPEYIVDQLEAEFIPYTINYLRSAMTGLDQDRDTVIAIRDVSSIFGFLRLSEIIKSCDRDIKGRMLIFFPGEFDQNHYRLLDARDGWDYLARPITI